MTHFMVDCILLSHSSVGGHLGCFPLLLIASQSCYERRYMNKSLSESGLQFKDKGICELLGCPCRKGTVPEAH